MLDTRFPRPPGDIGNPATFDFPVDIIKVAGASPRKVVVDGAPGLLDAFVAAGLELVARGAIGITTSCGFLTPFQKALAERLPVPVAVSSLLQVPMAQAMLLPGRRCGVITIDRTSLSGRHLAAVGAPADTPVVGMPADGAFQRTILGDRPHLDMPACAEELVIAGRQLLAECPEVGAIVLECTNLPPYQARLQAELGLPVYDVTSLLNWFWAGLTPRLYGAARTPPAGR